MSGSARRVLAISRKEFLHILKDPRTLLIVFLLPLVQLIMFGYSFRLEIQEIKLAVLDRSNSAESRSLVQLFAGSELFTLSGFDGAPGGMETLFKERKAKAVLVIPSDFCRTIRRSGVAGVQIVIDASDPNAAVLVRNYCNQVIAGFNETIAPGRSLPFEVRSSILYNPDMKSSFFFVPGIVAMIMVMICALLTSITVSREKEAGTMEQILVSPVRPHEIIIGKVLPYIVLAFLDGVFILLAGIFMFGVPFRGDVPLMIALSTLYLVTALSLGLMISTQARTQQVAIMMALVATLLPTILLSGLVFPIESMPPLLRLITYAVPAKYYLMIIRGIMLKGSSFGDLWKPALCMFVMMAVLLAVAVRRFGMKLEW